MCTHNTRINLPPAGSFPLLRSSHQVCSRTDASCWRGPPAVANISYKSPRGTKTSALTRTGTPGVRCPARTRHALGVEVAGALWHPLQTRSSTSPPSSRFRRRTCPSNLLLACDVAICLCGCNRRSWLVAGGRAWSGGALSASPTRETREPSPRKLKELRLGRLQFLTSSVCRLFLFISRGTCTS